LEVAKVQRHNINRILEHSRFYILWDSKNEREKEGVCVCVLVFVFERFFGLI
jgi:hypothetical protein